MRPLPCVASRAPQRFVFPLRQNLQLRHSGMYSGITWSPAARLRTSGPTSSTTPAPSWPSTAGKRPDGSRPLMVYASVWHTPVATSRTRHSPARGPSRSTSSIASGVRGSHETAALIFMRTGSAALRRLVVPAIQRAHHPLGTRRRLLHLAGAFGSEHPHRELLHLEVGGVHPRRDLPHVAETGHERQARVLVETPVDDELLGRRLRGRSPHLRLRRVEGGAELLPIGRRRERPDEVEARIRVDEPLVRPHRREPVGLERVPRRVE